MESSMPTTPVSQTSRMSARCGSSSRIWRMVARGCVQIVK
jgi:hypothetical protein